MIDNTLKSTAEPQYEAPAVAVLNMQKTYKFYGFSSFVTIEDSKAHFGITE